MTVDAVCPGGISARMPNEMWSWITACPMSSTFTWNCASTLVTADTKPGRSRPVTLIR